jgi:uncharacterized repeat protein (TIGR01451 family)
MTRTLRALLIILHVLFAAPALRANIFFTITPEHCAYADGYIGSTVTGGVPPYTYAWSDGPTTQNRGSLPAGSYTLTVTDFVGAQQQNTAIVPNLPNWEWDPNGVLAQAIPSCLPEPEPNYAGFVFFGGDIDYVPRGPAPHQFDHSCAEQPFTQGTYPDDWSWFAFFGLTQAQCYFAIPGETYAVNYTDANGCPGYMEAAVPQVPVFNPVSILDIQGSCSGGANGSVSFSISPEPDYIYGVRPHLFNPDGQENNAFWNTMATNWTDGWTYDVPNLGPGTHMLVRRLTIDPDFAAQFPCGDTTYITIPDLGPTCGHISGTVAMDIDEDCALDFSDSPVPEMVIEFTPGPYYATTNAQGEYGINLPLGNYTVTQQTSVVDEHCLLDPITLDVVGSATFNLLDTATQALDIQLSMASGPARPGFQLQYAIDLDNLTSATSNTNQVVMSFDPAVSFLSAWPTPSNVSGNTITWNNAGSLYYFGHRDISVNLQVPPDVGLIGTDLQATATVTPGAADMNAANNTASVITTVTGSYDPNDKTATTSSQWSRDLYYIDVDQWIDYTVRFQNTGTDTAFTVVITDTLPATLDAGSITMGAGSHPFTWELQGNGTLKWYFINILVPDSNVNEPGSHGFVSFRIRPRLPVVAGTVIENIANIFFDFNDPVITEPSVLVAESSTEVGGEEANSPIIAPNPATTEVRVTAGPEVIARVALFAADGRMMMNTIPNATATTLNIDQLPSGVYIVQVDHASGTILRKRLIKH